MSNILFVFEGEKTEKIVVKSLQKHIFKDNCVIKCAFGANIYDLYREIEDDEDLDTFNLIKEKNAENRKILDGFTRKDFAEIYLFFDYDAHASLASSIDRYGNKVKCGDSKLIEMLEVFDDESDKGKLYISYPMVEAFRHIVSFETFYDLKVKCKGLNCKYSSNCQTNNSCKDEPRYKKLVANDCIAQLNNINGYTIEIWKQIINAHLSKLNYIVNSIYEFPTKKEKQIDIFTTQLSKYIEKQCPEVAVLSAFPIFILDYYGIEKTRKLTTTNI